MGELLGLSPVRSRELLDRFSYGNFSEDVPGILKNRVLRSELGQGQRLKDEEVALITGSGAVWCRIDGEAIGSPHKGRVVPVSRDGFLSGGRDASSDHNHIVS
ncbi:MAG: hypothetical protein JRJ26_16495 [Deltaproteobacteria bacterium]|nr:hypothetical protein [Deltaproteobacteria bacterium]